MPAPSHPLNHYASQSPETQRQLDRYIELLLTWNTTYRLTGFSSRGQILEEFIEQSLGIAPYLEGTRFLDLGSGAGVPGLILAIAHPEWELILLDSNHKKIRFLRHVIAQLDLKNVRAVHARVEDFQTQEPIDGLLTKAFAPLERTTALCSHLPIHRHYALKGPQGQIEANTLGLPFRCIPLNVSDPSDRLYCIEMRTSSEGYPSETQKDS